VVVKIVVLGAADSAFIGITEKLGNHFTAAAIAGAKFLSGSSPTCQGSFLFASRISKNLCCTILGLSLPSFRSPITDSSIPVRDLRVQRITTILEKR
jgi:hypothetical protein